LKDEFQVEQLKGFGHKGKMKNIFLYTVEFGNCTKLQKYKRAGKRLNKKESIIIICPHCGFNRAYIRIIEREKKN
jgi:hypothetical protein